MKSAEIRKKFIDFFVNKNHTLRPSSALVPGNDPTLLFTNAGMVQFKEIFLGLEKPSYNRAVTIQKCIRAGGKHNDLENVGYTARHHTFFEMLGNFSFGNYFKCEAIHYAWEFLTEILKLPKEKLWITVYKDDLEAENIWLNEIGIPANRLSRCDEDNFWAMGDTGPCGPCSEIFYDHGETIAGGPPGSPDADGDRYTEIWNLVFMQYNRDQEGNLHPLPKPSVDTGMGLERIAAVMQQVHNNYDIDGFQHIIQAIHILVPQENVQHPSLKVIADHIRASAFLIAEGVMPGNEGRGYVLRRIIRRAIRHGHKLNLPHPFFADLVKPLAEMMVESYPEISSQQSMIRHVLLQEEQQFVRTLAQGLKILQEAMQVLENNMLSGEAAFKLYDTYGFPLDLTQDIAREHHIQVDISGFNQCMQVQKIQSQTSSQFSVNYFNTPLSHENTPFHGYETESLSSVITVLANEQGCVTALTSGMEGQVILQATPFYAESGGQVGDKGQLITAEAVFKVQDTQRQGQAIVHFGKVEQGILRIGEKILAEVDSGHRSAVRLNHTATHLLHAALKKVIGDHVQQKGSLVDSMRARFDFSHRAPLSTEDLQRIELLVNQEIRANHPVVTELMPIEQAKKTGAAALFGEKYADEVRVLSLGDFSKELCGGTHAVRTGDLGLFKITAEYGVASGIRRIEMLTGEAALLWIQEQSAQMQTAAAYLKTAPAQLVEKLIQLQEESKQKEKELLQLQAKLNTQKSRDLIKEVEIIHGLNVLITTLPDAEMVALRMALDQLKSQLDPAVIVLYSQADGKLSVVASVSKSLLEKVPAAPELVKMLCGKGGGRPDMAQGGGLIPFDLQQRIEGIKAAL